MQGMRVASVNVGVAETIRRGDQEIRTGIRKQSVAGSVPIHRDGVGDDVICNTVHHGGPDQAVYVYGTTDYEWWSAELGVTLEPGRFGENLTIDGLPGDMNVGDRLLIGSVILEATSPRIPCATLAAELGDSGFGLRFRQAERPGFYFRVLNDGEVAAGDGITLIEDESSTVSMLELFRLRYVPSPGKATLERVLEVPLAERMRDQFQAKLDTLR